MALLLFCAGVFGVSVMLAVIPAALVNLLANRFKLQLVRKKQG